MHNLLQITSSSVSLIDRERKNLTSSIDIVTVNKRVKTYNARNRGFTRNLSKQFHHFKLPEIEEVKVDYDNTPRDKNLEIVKNEMDKKVSESKSDEIFKVDEQNCSLNTKEETTPSLDMYNGDDINTESFADDDKTEVKSEEPDHQMIDDEEKNFDIQLIANINDNESKKSTKEDKVKPKKFEVVEGTKNDLDPNHWLKINLNEEEAMLEFKARALDSKYLSAAYKCEVCFKGFSKEDMLNRHVKLRHSEVSYLNQFLPFYISKTHNFVGPEIPNHYTIRTASDHLAFVSLHTLQLNSSTNLP